jgi:hypothetical protein
MNRSSSPFTTPKIFLFGTPIQAGEDLKRSLRDCATIELGEGLASGRKFLTNEQIKEVKRLIGTIQNRNLACVAFYEILKSPLPRLVRTKHEILVGREIFTYDCH